MPLISITKAIEYLNNFDVVGIPTETVYGLAANGTSDAAVAKIYSLKNRPQFNPLIMHVSSIDMVKAWAEITPLTQTLMDEFWYKRKSSISFVLKLKKHHPLSLLALAGLDTVAVRRPNHPTALEILKNLDFPLAAPSANRSNNLSPTSIQHVLRSLGSNVPVVDGGSCTVGIESTIVEISNDNIAILRLGSVTAKDLSEFGDIHKADSTIKAPGMLKRHYSPSRPLKMNVLKKEPGMALLGFGACDADLNLSESENLTEAATNLFNYLHQLDIEYFSSIGVSPIPNIGIGEAINDRLSRACS